MSVRNVSFMLKECIEAKGNGEKLQTGCLWCFASWVPYWSVLGLEYQSWYIFTTLLWVFWHLQVIFPFEKQDFGTQSWVPRLKNFKSQVFIFIRDVHRQWVKWHLNCLSRNGWAMWSCCCGAHLFLMPIWWGCSLPAEECRGAAHPWSTRQLWAGLFAGSVLG